MAARFDLILIEGVDRVVREFVASRAPMGHAEFTDGDKGFAIVNSQNQMVAGIVFSDWRPHFGTLEISAVALNSFCISPQIVVALGDYAFGKLSANRVWARTASKNHRAAKLLKHIGFTSEGTAADFYGVNRHAETFRMLKREWTDRYSLKAAA